MLYRDLGLLLLYRVGTTNAIQRPRLVAALQGRYH